MGSSAVVRRLYVVTSRLNVPLDYGMIHVFTDMSNGCRVDACSLSLSTNPAASTNCNAYGYGNIGMSPCCARVPYQCRKDSGDSFRVPIIAIWDLGSLGTSPAALRNSSSSRSSSTCAADKRPPRGITV